MKNKKVYKEYLYIVSDLLTGNKTFLKSIKDVAYHTGLGVGYLTNRLKGNREIGKIVFDSFQIDHRERNIGDEKLIQKPTKAEKIDTKTIYTYSIFIGEVNGYNYYITTDKQLEKSKIRETTNNGNNLTVDRFEITEQDLALFDLEKEYQDKIASWKDKPMYRGDIELVNQLIDDILIIKKRKKNIKQFGRGNIR
jgi:hypothetical protein